MSSVLLLGPGHPDDQLEIREKIKHILEKDGGREAIIMEHVYPNLDRPLHDAFEDLLEEKKPEFIIALYTKDGTQNAVDFELGVLTCHFTSIKEKILILTNKALNEEKITSYLTNGIYYKVINRKYDTLEEAAHEIVVFMNAR